MKFPRIFSGRVTSIFLIFLGIVFLGVLFPIMVEGFAIAYPPKVLASRTTGDKTNVASNNFMNKAYTGKE